MCAAVLGRKRELALQEGWRFHIYLNYIPNYVSYIF